MNHTDCWQVCTEMCLSNGKMHNYITAKTIHAILAISNKYWIRAYGQDSN